MALPRYSIDAIREHEVLVAYQLVSDQGYFSGKYPPTEEALQRLKFEVDFHNKRHSPQARTKVYS